jgi:hypothetical protein
MRREVGLVLTLLLPAVTNTDAAAGQRTVTEAECDASGVRITYRDGSTSTVALDAAVGQKCSALRISGDRMHVGWLRQWEEAERRDGRIVDRHSANELFVDGKVVAEYSQHLSVYLAPGWRFSSDGTKVVFCAGPSHGGCTFYLVDIATKKRVKLCDQRLAPEGCLDWEKLFETENPEVHVNRLSGRQP